MRRVLGDALISTGTVMLVLLTLVSIDPNVRDRLSVLMGGSRGTSGLSVAASQIGEAARIVIVAARDQSVDQAPLMLFALAATVLFLFMIRT